MLRGLSCHIPQRPITGSSALGYLHLPHTSQQDHYPGLSSRGNVEHTASCSEPTLNEIQQSESTHQITPSSSHRFSDTEDRNRGREGERSEQAERSRIAISKSSGQSQVLQRQRYPYPQAGSRPGTSRATVEEELPYLGGAPYQPRGQLPWRGAKLEFA